MTFKEATQIALAEMAAELSPTSMPTWRSHAKGLLAYWKEDRDLRTVTRLEIQAWINWRAQTGVKASTIGHERVFLSRLWRVLEDRDLDNGFNPFQRLRMPKKRTDKRKISEEVVGLIEDRVSEHDRDLINLTLLTFLRRLEVFRLTPQDVTTEPDPDNPGEVLYRLRVITSKTGKGRVVPLIGQSIEIINRRLETAREQGLEYLFGNQGPNRFKAAVAWAHRVWYPLIKQIGKGGHFHGLRHRGAHLAWKNGAPIEATSKMLGHSNIPQTEHYIGVTEDTMWAAARAVGQGVAAKASPAAPTPKGEPKEIPRQSARRSESDWMGF